MTDGLGPAHIPRVLETPVPGAQAAAADAVLEAVAVVAAMTSTEVAAVRTESGNQLETHHHPTPKRRRSHTMTEKVHLPRLSFRRCGKWSLL